MIWQISLFVYGQSLPFADIRDFEMNASSNAKPASPSNSSFDFKSDITKSLNDNQCITAPAFGDNLTTNTHKNVRDDFMLFNSSKLLLLRRGNNHSYLCGDLVPCRNKSSRNKEDCERTDITMTPKEHGIFDKSLNAHPSASSESKGNSPLLAKANRNFRSSDDVRLSVPPADQIEEKTNRRNGNGGRRASQDDGGRVREVRGIRTFTLSKSNSHLNAKEKRTDPEAKKRAINHLHMQQCFHCDEKHDSGRKIDIYLSPYANQTHRINLTLCSRELKKLISRSIKDLQKPVGISRNGKKLKRSFIHSQYNFSSRKSSSPDQSRNSKKFKSTNRKRTYSYKSTSMSSVDDHVSGRYGHSENTNMSRTTEKSISGNRKSSLKKGLPSCLNKYETNQTAYQLATRKKEGCKPKADIIKRSNKELKDLIQTLSFERQNINYKNNKNIPHRKIDSSPSRVISNSSSDADEESITSGGPHNELQETSDSSISGNTDKPNSNTYTFGTSENSVIKPKIFERGKRVVQKIRKGKNPDINLFRKESSGILKNKRAMLDAFRLKSKEEPDLLINEKEIKDSWSKKERSRSHKYAKSFQRSLKHVQNDYLQNYASLAPFSKYIERKARHNLKKLKHRAIFKNLHYDTDSLKSCDSINTKPNVKAANTDTSTRFKCSNEGSPGQTVSKVNIGHYSRSGKGDHVNNSYEHSLFMAHSSSLPHGDADSIFKNYKADQRPTESIFLESPPRLPSTFKRYRDLKEAVRKSRLSRIGAPKPKPQEYDGSANASSSNISAVDSRICKLADITSDPTQQLQDDRKRKKGNSLFKRVASRWAKSKRLITTKKAVTASQNAPSRRRKNEDNDSPGCEMVMPGLTKQKSPLQHHNLEMINRSYTGQKSKARSKQQDSPPASQWSLWPHPSASNVGVHQQTLDAPKRPFSPPTSPRLGLLSKGVPSAPLSHATATCRAPSLSHRAAGTPHSQHTNSLHPHSHRKMTELQQYIKAIKSSPYTDSPPSMHFAGERVSYMKIVPTGHGAREFELMKIPLNSTAASKCKEGECAQTIDKKSGLNCQVIKSLESKRIKPTLDLPFSPPTKGLTKTNGVKSIKMQYNLKKEDDNKRLSFTLSPKSTISPLPPSSEGSSPTNYYSSTVLSVFHEYNIDESKNIRRKPLETVTTMTRERDNQNIIATTSKQNVRAITDTSKRSDYFKTTFDSPSIAIQTDETCFARENDAENYTARRQTTVCLTYSPSKAIQTEAMAQGHEMLDQQVSCNIDDLLDFNKTGKCKQKQELTHSQFLKVTNKIVDKIMDISKTKNIIKRVGLSDEHPKNKPDALASANANDDWYRTRKVYSPEVSSKLEIGNKEILDHQPKKTDTSVTKLNTSFTKNTSKDKAKYYREIIGLGKETKINNSDKTITIDRLNLRLRDDSENKPVEKKQIHHQRQHQQQHKTTCSEKQQRVIMTDKLKEDLKAETSQCLLDDSDRFPLVPPVTASRTCLLSSVASPPGASDHSRRHAPARSRPALQLDHASPTHIPTRHGDQPGDTADLTKGISQTKFNHLNNRKSFGKTEMAERQMPRAVTSLLKKMSSSFICKRRSTDIDASSNASVSPPRTTGIPVRVSTPIKWHKVPQPTAFRQPTKTTPTIIASRAHFGCNVLRRASLSQSRIPVAVPAVMPRPLDSTFNSQNPRDQSKPQSFSLKQLPKAENRFAQSSRKWMGETRHQTFKQNVVHQTSAQKRTTGVLHKPTRGVPIWKSHPDYKPLVSVDNNNQNVPSQVSIEKRTDKQCLKVYQTTTSKGEQQVSFNANISQKSTPHQSSSRIPIAVKQSSRLDIKSSQTMLRHDVNEPRDLRDLNSTHGLSSHEARGRFHFGALPRPFTLPLHAGDITRPATEDLIACGVNSLRDIGDLSDLSPRVRKTGLEISPGPATKSIIANNTHFEISPGAIVRATPLTSPQAGAEARAGCRNREHIFIYFHDEHSQGHKEKGAASPRPRRPAPTPARAAGPGRHRHCSIVELDDKSANRSPDCDVTGPHHLARSALSLAPAPRLHTHKGIKLARTVETKTRVGHEIVNTTRFSGRKRKDGVRLQGDQTFSFHETVNEDGKVPEPIEGYMTEEVYNDVPGHCRPQAILSSRNKRIFNGPPVLRTTKRSLERSRKVKAAVKAGNKYQQISTITTNNPLSINKSKSHAPEIGKLTMMPADWQNFKRPESKEAFSQRKHQPKKNPFLISTEKCLEMENEVIVVQDVTNEISKTHLNSSIFHLASPPQSLSVIDSPSMSFSFSQ